MSIYDSVSFLAKGNNQIREVSDTDLMNLTMLSNTIEANGGKPLLLNPFTLTHDSVEYEYHETELYHDRSGKDINLFHFEESDGDKSITLATIVHRRRGKRTIFAAIDKDYLDAFKFLLKVEA